MAVAIDATGTDQLSGTTVTSFNHTTGPNVSAGLSNGAIIFGLQFDTNVSSITVKWGAQTLTRIGTGITTGATRRAELFAGVAPTSGVQTLAITWTTAAQVCVGGISVSGANQTGGTTTFKNSNTGTHSTGATLSVAITSAVGDMTVASCVQDGSASFSSWNNTSVYIDNGGASIDAGMSRAAGAASVTMTATLSSTSNNTGIIGVDIAAAAVAAAVYIPYRRTRTFVVPRLLLK